MNPHKKMAFTWSKEQVGQSIIKDLKVGSQALRKHILPSVTPRGSF